MKKSRRKTTDLVTIAMLSGILLLMSYTPLGYLNIGPLAISFNMIPVAIAGIALGPVYGGILGGVFGLTSFLQCVGFGGTSAMGVILFEISPVLTFVQRVVPRVLAGILCGYTYRGCYKLFGHTASCFVTGFCSAFLNTVLFMSALVLIFWNTDYLQTLIGGRNVIVFVCTFVGINAVSEMIANTVVVGAVGKALEKTRIIRRVS